ncbi:MAG: hypothetical protein ACOVO5_09780 [Devosia sp.]|jgi:hypothetical protein|uniref:hypothetical protein n=1 Tax=Devosia sp. TaxID=1871048 RepID=UPI0037C0F48A
MATAIKMSPRTGREAARVDFLVDENGERIDVPDDGSVQPTRDSERAIGATSPANWWRWSLVALGAVALVLLIMQVFSGTPGTNVQPGTPVAAPQEPAPQP